MGFGIFVLVLFILGIVIMIVSPDEPEPKAEVADQAETEETEKKNIFMNLRVKEGDVKSGNGLNVIGTYAYVKAKPEMFHETTQEEFQAFVHEKIEDSGYNWFTIEVGDKGIVFPGSHTVAVYYGRLEDDGSVTDDSTEIFYDFDNERWDFPEEIALKD